MHVGGLGRLAHLPGPVLAREIHWDRLLLLLEERLACSHQACLMFCLLNAAAIHCDAGTWNVEGAMQPQANVFDELCSSPTRQGT